ncbi:MAG: ABC transporter permease [Bacteroidetes bacterium]|nr:ABC transporter permease [Bacteroidota bacterium]
MFERDNWQEIFATIKKNKLRTTLTMFGVFWGILMLVIMLGSGNGLRHGILRQFEGSATNSFYLWTQVTTKAYKGMKPGRHFNYNNTDTKILERDPDFMVVSAQNQLGDYNGQNNVVHGLKTGAFAVLGQYPNLARIENIAISKGRYINELDIREKRKVCVVSSRVLEALFTPDENPIGQYIRINGVFFKIIGTTTPVGSGQAYRESANKIRIPFTTFQQAFNYGDIVGWFAVLARPDLPGEKVEQKAIDMMKERHKISPEDMQAVGHWNMATEYDKITGLFNGIELLVWFVGIGTLMAGVIGVSNIMLIVVKERTREIGVKRALGATPFKVISQIILEALFLTSMAGLAGLGLGVSAIHLLNEAIPVTDDSMFVNPTVNITVVVYALMVLVLSGALAGFIPARKAVAINPVEALRAE